MINFDNTNTYLDNNTIYSKGPSPCGYNYVKYFLKENNDIKSFLDIGCGNGRLLKLMNKKTNYLGVDADVGIYNKKKHKKLKYFKDAKKTETYLEKHNKKYDCVVLMDVLEHTDTFLKLLSIALKKSNKYVLVGLPNEDYLMSRLRFFFGKGLLTHGLELVYKKPGHKHQWFIQYKIASPLLISHAKKYKYTFSKTFFYVNQPRIFWKRYLYKMLLFFLPKHIQMSNFCMIFKKI